MYCIYTNIVFYFLTRIANLPEYGDLRLRSRCAPLSSTKYFTNEEVFSKH